MTTTFNYMDGDNRKRKQIEVGETLEAFSSGDVLLLTREFEGLEGTPRSERPRPGRYRIEEKQIETTPPRDGAVSQIHITYQARREEHS